MLRSILFTLLLTASLFAAPSQQLLDVLNRFGLCHDGSWESIQRETEAAWLSHGRQVELWELEKMKGYSDEEVYALFTPLGMTQSIYPACTHYDYAVILGAREDFVRARLLFLKALDVSFDQLVVLTGDRPLGDFERKGARNETEMIEQLLEELDLPEEWKDKTVFVDTPRPEGMRRPHTDHTFEYWNPAPGSALIVTNQPFVYRQGAIAQNYLDCIDPVGGGFAVEQLQGRVQVLLAELAQWIKIEYLQQRTDSNPSPLNTCWQIRPLPAEELRR